MLLFLFYCIFFSEADRLLLANPIGYGILLSWASYIGQPVPSLVCSRTSPSPILDASVSKYNAFMSLLNFMQIPSFIIDFTL